VEEALFLTKFARSVTVVHRRNSFRAEKILQNRLFANPKINVIWNATLDEVSGTDSPKAVTGAKLRDILTGESTQIRVDGIFIAIGHEPATALFKDQVEMTPSGYIVTAAKSASTNVAGVFAAGDVTDDTYRQAVTAAGMGCMAALDAERYLASLETVAQAAE
jgi:thioredoxin reductase (NADPH)